MADMEELKKRLDKAAGIESILDRRLYVLAILTECLSMRGIQPILVGGTAVEMYTLGGYQTKDVDVIMDSTPAVLAAMEQLGFTRQGRYWVREDIDIAIEAPAGPLAGDMEHVIELDIEDMPVYVIGVEDLLIDRLNAYVHWKSTEDKRWAERILEAQQSRIDWGYLRQQAAREKVEAALNEIIAELEKSDAQNQV